MTRHNCTLLYRVCWRQWRTETSPGHVRHDLHADRSDTKSSTPTLWGFAVRQLLRAATQTHIRISTESHHHFYTSKLTSRVLHFPRHSAAQLNCAIKTIFCDTFTLQTYTMPQRYRNSVSSRPNVLHYWTTFTTINAKKMSKYAQNVAHIQHNSPAV